MFLFQSGGKSTFAEALKSALADTENIRVAVAWTRLSGLDLVWDELESSLERGSMLTFVTGVDAANTSSEALQSLVSLQERFEKVSCFVRHQENAPLFHPKLYAVQSLDQWTAFVGSSNFTASGFHSNEELMVRLSIAPGTDMARSFEAAWRRITDHSSSFLLPLDQELCVELERLGYTESEASSFSADKENPHKLKRKSPIFGVSRPGPPPFQGSVLSTRSSISPGRRHVPTSPVEKNSNRASMQQLHAGAAISNDWSRISIRLLRSRGTQAQLPKAVFEAIKRKLGHENMLESCEVRDRTEGVDRRVSPVGSGNTFKLETGMSEDIELVAKFEAYDSGVEVEFFDASKGEGKRIFEYLQAGEKHEPPKTINVKPSADNATLYRVD